MGIKLSRQNGNKHVNNDIRILNCLYFNARSLVHKRDELELYINEKHIDLIGVAETWLNEDIGDSEMNFEGFSIFRKDRNSPTKKRGGGVAFYIRNELSGFCREELFEIDFPETIWCTISCNGESTLVGVCYRPPDSTQINDKALYSLINKVGQEQNVVIMGDFNFSELDWGKMESIDYSHPFLECIGDNFMSQLVDEPTRGSNYLDLVLTSDEDLVQEVTVGEHFATSDHNVVKFNIIIKGDSNYSENKTFNYYKADYNEIRNYAITLNLEEKIDFYSGNVDNAWNIIKDDIIQMRNKFIPLNKASKNKSKWVTRKVTRSRRAKKKAWNKYVKNGRDPKLYKIYRAKLKASINENIAAKSSFEEKLANKIKTDSKSFYAYVSSKRRCKVKIGPMRNNSGDLINDRVTQANMFNNYFSSVFTKEDLHNIPIPTNLFNDLECNSLHEIFISEKMVLEKLEKLNINKSQGPDEIHPKLLYELRYQLAKPLTALFKNSVTRGEVPGDWRDANVTPIHKKGSKAKPENYRPVSLTSVVGKLLESIVKENVVQHLDKFNLINSSQHGFTTGRSCLTNLLDFLENATKELDEDKALDLVYLDFAKAFDKVPYCRLFKKIEAHGIGGSVLNWVQSWLRDRRQRVCVDREYSGWEQVTSGVPQGSVLGPILFVIYINDLDSELVSKIGKFADDTKMCKGITNLEDAHTLQEDLNKLSKWSADWQMEFNTDKCSVIHVGKNNIKHQYSLCNKVLKASSREADLGIIMNDSLKFSEQCNSVVKGANSILGLIRRTIKNKSKRIITQLYKTLVRPKLEYCVQAWRPHLQKDICAIERVQHRATKMIKEIKALTYEERLAATGLITLEERRNRGDLIEVFKIIKGFEKVDYNNFFKLTHSGRTRGHRYKLSKSRSRLDIRRNFFSQRIVNDWNKLPTIVVEADSINSFKNRYDSYKNEEKRRNSN